MIPFLDVVTFAIAVVLQEDDGHEVTVCEFRVDCFDFFVQGHYAALTSAPVKYTDVELVPDVCPAVCDSM